MFLKSLFLLPSIQLIDWTIAIIIMTKTLATLPYCWHLWSYDCYYCTEINSHAILQLRKDTFFHSLYETLITRQLSALSMLVLMTTSVLSVLFVLYFHEIILLCINLHIFMESENPQIIIKKCIKKKKRVQHLPGYCP